MFSPKRLNKVDNKLPAGDGGKETIMKELILAVTLLTLAVGFSTAQEGGSVKKVQVTKQTLADQPAGESYRIDLTRNGTVYEVAAGIDYSRVRVRTSTGEVALREMVRKSGGTGKFLLGTGNDLSAIDFGFPPGGGTFQPPGGGATQWKCHPEDFCSCKGPTDCDKLHDQKFCKDDDWVCGEGKGGGSGWGCFCIKTAS